MSGLKEFSSGNITYVNLREGRLVVKQSDGTFKEYMSIEGHIKRVTFIEQEIEGKKVEKAKFEINCVGETLILQMKTDSGYFRGLCNSLRSSKNPKEMVAIQPHYSKSDGKPKTTCFVSQNGITLKHFFKKDNLGELPPLETQEFKGQIHYDGTKQIEFWKNWLNSIYGNELPSPPPAPAPLSEKSEALDDLPF